ncbi:hypothetical protein BAU01nite_03390 [Brevibacterium aurantiacum]|nr:hypothetical protein BAU01nite_03390 [Brevibacterium aurantiacum]
METGKRTNRRIRISRRPRGSAQWAAHTITGNPVLEQLAGMIAILVLLIIGAFAAGFIDTRLPRGFSLKGSTADGPR